MKTKYRSVKDLLCWAFVDKDRYPNSEAPLLLELANRWEKTNHGFSQSVIEVVRRRREEILFGWFVLASLLLFILVYGVMKSPTFYGLFPADAQTKEFFRLARVLCLVFFGASLGGWTMCRPYLNHVRRLEDFFGTIEEVIWAVTVDQYGESYARRPEKVIRHVLKNLKFPKLFADVDQTLVHLAFPVKLLERTCAENDPDLQKAREHAKRIHAKAYMLELAEKDPQTYFDRAHLVLPDNRGEIEFAP